MYIIIHIFTIYLYRKLVYASFPEVHVDLYV